MAQRIILHGVSGRPGSALEALARDRPQSVACQGRLVHGFGRVVASISGADTLIPEFAEGLPHGAARAEALAIRLRRGGLHLEWGEPQRFPDAHDVLRFSWARGRSSVEMMRADGSLLSELQLGGWFDVGWHARLARRVAVGLPRAVPGSRAAAAVCAAADAAFWHGARSTATAAEWRRLTRSSYSALVYHRLAGAGKVGQERVDLSPERFERQLRLLRRLGFRHLQPEEMLRFHENADALLPPRSFVVTLDDGFTDCFGPLLRHGPERMQLFVPTYEVGGRARWLDDEAVMAWDEIETLAAAGVAVGSHARRHVRLGTLSTGELDAELEGSFADLERELPSPLPVIAYPYGDHDLRVREAAARSRYRAAFTTDKGRNGAGTDVYGLRRVSVHKADGALATLWKTATGEALPRPWLLVREQDVLPKLFLSVVRRSSWLLAVPALRAAARRRVPYLADGEVTVVTVNWNSSSYLRVLLRLVRLRSPPGTKILIVDNGSSGEAQELPAADDSVTVVRLPFNVGHDLALDIGFLLARTEYVIALDVDAFPLHDRWQEELLRPLSAGFELAGARLNREYVHPCCLAIRTARFIRRGHSFRSHYKPRTGDNDASGDIGEELSSRERGKLHFFDATSTRGPGDVGTVFGNFVYHNFYSTRFRASGESVLDGVVLPTDPAAAWAEALQLYDVV